MEVPGPWSALILVACAFRLWRLLADDKILDPYRFQLVGLPRDWEEDDPIPDDYRNNLAMFINCPWCLGFWVGFVVWGLWEITPHWTEVFAMPFVISAGVGLIRERLDSSE